MAGVDEGFLINKFLLGYTQYVLAEGSTAEYTGYTDALSRNLDRILGLNWGNKMMGWESSDWRELTKKDIIFFFCILFMHP